MSIYQKRYINFNEVIEVNDWKIKVYTISKTEEFSHDKFYKNVQFKLFDWLQTDNGFNNENDKIGFLILHAGTEGIFSLINWWVGSNMLNTLIYLSEYSSPTNFKKISGHGLAPCIWELEIINHERKMWTDCVLKKVPEPDLKTYLNATFSGKY